jgi:hypothetical protein
VPPIDRGSASGSRSSDPEPVAVRVFDVDLATGETFLIDREPELRRNSVDVLHIQVDERVRPRVALVLRITKAELTAARARALVFATSVHQVLADSWLTLWSKR